MAPRLSDADHKMMEAMFQRGEPTKQIAQAVQCDPRTVRKARARYWLFESTKAPPNCVGRYKKIIPYKRDALLDRLAEHPTTDRSQIVTFLRDEFEDEVSLSTTSRPLKDARWTRNNCHRVARQGNPQLRDLIWYQTAIMDVWRPFLKIDSVDNMAQSTTANEAYGASAKQLKRLVYLYRKTFESTNPTMLVTPGFLSLLNEVFRNPDVSDAQFWFIFSFHGCLSIAPWCIGLHGISEALMTIAWQSDLFQRRGWTNSMIEDIRARTRALAQDNTYRSLYPIKLDSSDDTTQINNMEVLAKEFRRLAFQYEPSGRSIEMDHEREIWKGDPRELTLTLSEATEVEEYTSF